MIFIKRTLLVFGFLAIVSTPLWAQTTSQPEIKGQYTLTEEDLFHICTLDVNDVNSFYYVPAPDNPAISPKLAKSAAISVTYVGDWPFAAQNAFDYAMDIWESHLESNVTIRIEANWRPLGERTLGSAGPTQIVQFSSGEPDTWYAIAQASAIAGVDFVQQSQGTENSVDHDIRININSDWAFWYYGTDAQTPEGMVDLVTVVLHEIGHGIGFTGSMRVPEGLTRAEWGYGLPLDPIIYDRFVIDGNGNEILNEDIYPNNSNTLFEAVTGNNGGIYAAGVNAILLNEGTAARLYSPNEWAGGSSYSHLDQTTYSGTVNALMRPQLNRALALHSPGPVVCGMLDDMGWPIGVGCDGALNAEALLTIDSSDLSFGVTNEGESLRKEITISNAIDAPGPLVSRVSLTGSSSFSINISDPILVLDPGESRRVSVLYRPREQEQSEGEVVITHNGINLESPYSLTLKGEALPANETFVLEQNYPNPFNASTNIEFALVEEAFVRLDVYDIMGRHIQSLVNEQRTSGRYLERLNANEFASGAYIYRIIIGGEARSGKLLLTK